MTMTMTRMATNANERGSNASVSSSTHTISSTNNSNMNSSSNINSISRTRKMYLEPALPLPPGPVYGADGMTNGMSCEGQFYNLPSITDGTPYPPISENPLRDIIATYMYEVNVVYDANVIDVIRDIETQIFRDIAEASPLLVGTGGGEGEGGDATTTTTTTQVICNKLLADALGILTYEDPNAGANPDDERVDDDDTPITMSPTPESESNSDPADPADPDGRFNKIRRRNRNRNRNLTRAHSNISNHQSHTHSHIHQIRNLQLNGDIDDGNDWKSYLGIKADPPDTIDQSSTATCKSEPVPGTTCYPVQGKTTAQIPVDNLDFDDQGAEIQILQKIKKSMQANAYVSADVPSMSFIGIEGEVYTGGGNDSGTVIETGNDDTTGTGTDGNGGGDELIIKPKDPEDPSLNDNLFTGLGIFFIVALVLSVGMTASILGVRMKRRRERLKGKKFKEFQDDAIAMGKVDGETAPMKTSQQLLVAPSSDSVEIVDMNNPNTGGPSWSIACTEGLTSIGALMDSFRRRDDDGISASGTSNDKNGADGIDDDDDLSVETKEYDDARLLEDPPTPTRMRSFIGGKK